MSRTETYFGCVELDQSILTTEHDILCSSAFSSRPHTSATRR